MQVGYVPHPGEDRSYFTRLFSGFNNLGREHDPKNHTS
jgi:hypothetical protein